MTTNIGKERKGRKECAPNSREANFGLPKKASGVLREEKDALISIPAGSGGLLPEISPNPSLYQSFYAAKALYQSRLQKSRFFELT